MGSSNGAARLTVDPGSFMWKMVENQVFAVMNFTLVSKDNFHKSVKSVNAKPKSWAELPAELLH